MQFETVADGKLAGHIRRNSAGTTRTDPGTAAGQRAELRALERLDDRADNAALQGAVDKTMGRPAVGRFGGVRDPRRGARGSWTGCEPAHAISMS